MPSKPQRSAADHPAVGHSTEPRAVVQRLTESSRVEPCCVLIRGARGSGRTRFLADVATGLTDASPRRGSTARPVTFIDDLDAEPLTDQDLVLRSLADRPDRPDVVASGQVQFA